MLNKSALKSSSAILVHVLTEVFSIIAFTCLQCESGRHRPISGVHIAQHNRSQIVAYRPDSRFLLGISRSPRLHVYNANPDGTDRFQGSILLNPIAPKSSHAVRNHFSLRYIIIIVLTYFQCKPDGRDRFQVTPRST